MMGTGLTEDQARRFIIRPNGSMSAKAGIAFFVSLACLSFAIAGVFFFLGMWLILPFAGVEMAALAVVLYLCHCRGKQQEIVTVSKDEVVISRGCARPERVCLFKRAWAQVRLQPPPFKGHPHRLLIGSHGRHIEVGASLSEPEKVALLNSLQSCIR